MKFAKLYDVSCGNHQILVTVEQDETEEWGMGFRTYVDELGIVHAFYRFEDMESLKKSFDMMSEKIASNIIADMVKEMRDQITEERVLQ